ncbi:MAG: TasA family protein [Bacillota bacterium]
MKKRVTLYFVLLLFTMAVAGAGATYALFSASATENQSTFRAATVGLSTTGSLDFDSGTLNIAPGESPEAHTDSITLDSSPSTIATKLSVTFALQDDQLGPVIDPSGPCSLAEGLFIDSIDYVSGSTVTNIASGITFDELVNDGMRVATYELGDVPANDTTNKQLIFKWHFPDNGSDDNKYQGASFTLSYFFTAEQAH